MESLEDVSDHQHEENPDIARKESTNFRWPAEATKIVVEGVLNHAKPNVIKRNLRNANVFGGKMPSQAQLYNKIAATKVSVFPSTIVTNTHELRLKVAEFSQEPEFESEAFVAYYDIEDDDDTKPPRFNVILSSKKNLKKLKSNRVLQTDATYRLNWMGFPVYVIGKSNL